MTTITKQDAFDYVLSKRPEALLSHISMFKITDYYGTPSVHVMLNFIDSDDAERTSGSTSWIAISDIENFLYTRDNAETTTRNKIAAFIHRNKLEENQKLVNIENFREVEFKGSPAYLVRYNWNKETESWSRDSSVIINKSDLEAFEK